MRIARETGSDKVVTRPAVSLLAPGLSLLALAAFAGLAMATDRPPLGGSCMAYNGSAAGLDGVDGCLRVGSHVHVESQVMHGSASLNAGLPGVFAGDGPSPASLRTEPTTRLRMHGMSDGGLFAR